MWGCRWRGEASAAGLSVVGLDVDAEVVDGLNHGRSHVDDLADADVVGMLGAGFFSRLVMLVWWVVRERWWCVFRRRCLLRGLRIWGRCGRPLGRWLSICGGGTLVILESTTYPGTTDEGDSADLGGGRVAGRVGILGWFFRRSGLIRVIRFGPKNTPKVVGGYTSGCADAAVAFYSRFIDTVVRARGTREAETAKLLENTYRHINIALVNEMARFLP